MEARRKRFQPRGHKIRKRGTLVKFFSRDIRFSKKTFISSHTEIFQKPAGAELLQKSEKSPWQILICSCKEI